VLDTPGMRELQLWEASDGIQGSFEDIVKLGNSCKFRDCSHRSEPGCAIRKAINSGKLKSERYESYLKLQRELRFLETRRDKKARSDERKKWAKQEKARRR
jgi:ribosome biogenesis GTPase